MPTIPVGPSETYTTIAAALASLPTVLVGETVIALAPGTYGPVDISDKVSAGSGSVRIVGPATMGAVTVRGRVTLTLDSVTVHAGAAIGVLVDGATLLLAGPVMIGGWTSDGMLAMYHARVGFKATGTLTVNGPGSSGIGLHLVNGSQCAVYANQSGIAIAIAGVQYGFQLGFNCAFTQQSTNGAVSVVNTNTPNNSAFAQCTDHSSWSTNRPITATKLTRLFDLNSISYAEATSTRTLSNVGVSQAVQNSVVYLP